MVQVVAAILERDGRVLICRRKPEQSHPLRWEFPGGKVEPGETPAQALARELEEELDIRGATGEEIRRYDYCYPGKSPIVLIFIRVREFSGEPRNVVFHEMCWAPPARLREYDFIEGDTEFLRTYTGCMATPITRIDPAQNEFLASLEAKSKKPSPFFRTMANRPEALQTFVPFYGAVAGPGSVDRRTKELIYLTVSYTNRCAFCSWAHTASGKKAGVTEDEMQALQAGREDGFSKSERAAIRYARELTKTADVAQSREELRRHFSDEQVVEITLLAAMANFTNRFNNGLQIMPEE